MTTALTTEQVAGTTRVLIIEDDPAIAEAVRRVVVKQHGTGVVPVLVLTAHDLDHDAGRGLNSGADDFLTKPFGAQELGARLQSLLARSQVAAPSVVAEPTRYRDGILEVDWPAREVRVDGEVVGLTKLEFQLLQTFVRHPGQALSTQQLLEKVWNDPLGIGPERVKFTVLRLRRKLRWQDEYKDVLEAIRGYGYRYTPVANRTPER